MSMPNCHRPLWSALPGEPAPEALYSFDWLMVDFGGTLAEYPPPGTPTLTAPNLVAAIRDSYGWSGEGFEQAIERALEALRQAARQQGLQRPVSRALEKAAQACGLPLPDTPEAVAATVMPLLGDRQVDPDAARAVQALADRGTRIMLAANTFVPLPVRRQTLRHAGILGCFSAIVLSSDLGVAKPHQEFYRTALKIADCAPGRALFVGDDETNDVARPRELGFQALRVTRIRHRDRCTPLDPPLFQDLPDLLYEVI
jgi:putative hydrolase of the HAD superfamily